MTHVRIDDAELNKHAAFECGIAWPLPDGDQYVYEGEIGLLHLVDCIGCGGGPRRLGIPISQLSGRPGHPGFERFCDIARSWGYD